MNDLEVLKELSWEVWKVKGKIKSKEIKERLEKIESKLVDVIEDYDEIIELEKIM